MFLLIILGYFLAVILLCCGISNAYAFASVADKSMGIFLFLEQLALALVPAAIGIIIMGIVQIAKSLDQLVFEQNQVRPSTPPREEEPRQRASREQKKQAPAETSYFGSTSQERPKEQPAKQSAIPLPILPEAANTSKPTEAQPEKLSFFNLD